jgi:DNA repair exonuclease SbcCD ATPase subunit
MDELKLPLANCE